MSVYLDSETSLLINGLLRAKHLGLPPGRAGGDLALILGLGDLCGVHSRFICHWPGVLPAGVDLLLAIEAGAEQEHTHESHSYQRTIGFHISYLQNFEVCARSSAPAESEQSCPGLGRTSMEPV